MDITKLNKIDSSSKKLLKKVEVFEKLLDELQKREIPSAAVEVINLEIEKVNSFSGYDKLYKKALVKSQNSILRIIENNSGLFVKNHFQQKWMSVGIGIGIAFGTAFGVSQGNMGLMALGIPIGLGTGIALGKKKDNEVFKIGKQLDVVVGY